MIVIPFVIKSKYPLHKFFLLIFFLMYFKKQKTNKNNKLIKYIFNVEPKWFSGGESFNDDDVGNAWVLTCCFEDTMDALEWPFRMTWFESTISWDASTCTWARLFFMCKKYFKPTNTTKATDMQRLIALNTENHIELSTQTIRYIFWEISSDVFADGLTLLKTFPIVYTFI